MLAPRQIGLRVSRGDQLVQEVEESRVDPRTFDGLIRKLSRTLSRRSLVGGSLGASVLAAVGLADDAQARKVKAEDCLPPGRRCGTKKNDEPCRKCCQRYHIVNPKGKKKCACRPDGVDCSNPSQCCSGACENGFCRSPAVATCRPAAAGCSSATQCCSGICEVGLCRPAPCRNVDAICGIDLDCCSGVCGCIEEFPFAPSCTCRNAMCVDPPGLCTVDADCCSEICSTTLGEDPPGECLPP